MGRIMQWQQAAIVLHDELGISKHELYTGLRSGKYPGFRVGGSRGRWLVDVDMVRTRIQELMTANVRQPELPEYGKLRVVR